MAISAERRAELVAFVLDYAEDMEFLSTEEQAGIRQLVDAANKELTEGTPKEAMQ